MNGIAGTFAAPSFPTCSCSGCPTRPQPFSTASGGFIGVNDVIATNSPTVTYGVQFVGNSLQLVVTQAQFVQLHALRFTDTPNETGRREPAA